ncbi:MAG: hypothetical protein MUO60_09545 [Clostridiaceae bacterium]|nr:hypothetical protein [Clostridiaceae bacterium]
MAKKIIIGLVITVVISLTAFGAIYAYQKEGPNLEKVNAMGYGINYSTNGHRAGECFELASGDDEWECPENEEQMRNNLRYREEECEHSCQMEAIRHEHQHMHENEYNEDCEQECEENERSFQNHNEYSNKQNRGMNS